MLSDVLSRRAMQIATGPYTTRQPLVRRGIRARLLDGARNTFERWMRAFRAPSCIPRTAPHSHLMWPDITPIRQASGSSMPVYQTSQTSQTRAHTSYPLRPSVASLLLACPPIAFVTTCCERASFLRGRTRFVAMTMLVCLRQARRATPIRRFCRRIRPISKIVPRLGASQTRRTRYFARLVREDTRSRPCAVHYL